MRDAAVRTYVAAIMLPQLIAQRLDLDDERGEGVISTAIAVLIMAGIGLAMWIAFDRIWRGAEGQIEGQIQQIGGGG